MQSVKYTGDFSQSNENLRFSDAGNTQGWTRWLPLLILIGAAVAIGLLGSADNPTKEVDWLSRLSNEGDTGAQVQLGVAYRDGLYGLKPDTKTAFYWLEKAAKNGNVYAEDAVGMAYMKGTGVARNVKLARQWWNKAIEDGSNEARVHLAESLIQQNHMKQAQRLLMK